MAGEADAGAGMKGAGAVADWMDTVAAGVILTLGGVIQRSAEMTDKESRGEGGAKAAEQLTKSVTAIARSLSLTRAEARRLKLEAAADAKAEARAEAEAEDAGRGRDRAGEGAGDDADAPDADGEPDADELARLRAEFQSRMDRLRSAVEGARLAGWTVVGRAEDGGDVGAGAARASGHA